MSSTVRLSSVCLSSVTFVRPTQAIEIFGNLSTPFDTLAICDLFVKILRRWSQGNPSVRGLNQRGVAKYSDDLSKAIFQKRCKIGGRKSHMSFRLVPKSVTMNGHERRNSPNLCIVSPNSVAFWTDYVSD